MKERKRSLLFFGIPIREGVSCEQLVADVIPSGMGITDSIDMNQANKGGKWNPGDVPVPEAESSRSVQNQTSHFRQSGIHREELSRRCPTETSVSHLVL